MYHLEYASKESNKEKMCEYGDAFDGATHSTHSRHTFKFVVRVLIRLFLNVEVLHLENYEVTRSVQRQGKE